MCDGYIMILHGKLLLTCGSTAQSGAGAGPAAKRGGQPATDATSTQAAVHVDVAVHMRLAFLLLAVVSAVNTATHDAK